MNRVKLGVRCQSWVRPSRDSTLECNTLSAMTSGLIKHREMNGASSRVRYMSTLCYMPASSGECRGFMLVLLFPCSSTLALVGTFAYVLRVDQTFARFEVHMSSMLEVSVWRVFRENSLFVALIHIDRISTVILRRSCSAQSTSLASAAS